MPSNIITLTFKWKYWFHILIQGAVLSCQCWSLLIGISMEFPMFFPALFRASACVRHGVPASEMHLDCWAAFHWSLRLRWVLQPRKSVARKIHVPFQWPLDDFMLDFCVRCGSIMFNPDCCVRCGMGSPNIDMDQSFVCQGQVQQSKNPCAQLAALQTSMASKHPCVVRMSDAQIDCSTRNQRLRQTLISQEIYGATCMCFLTL